MQRLLRAIAVASLAIGSSTTFAQSSCVGPTLALVGRDDVRAGFTTSFELAIRDVTGELTVAWDLDDDGVVDHSSRFPSRPGLNAAGLWLMHPAAARHSATVRVTDGAGCSAQARHTTDVKGPVVDVFLAPPEEVCGDGDISLEPGERFRVPVTIRNIGFAAMRDGHAIFTLGQGARDAAGAGELRILTPAIPIGELDTDATLASAVEFEVDGATECGTPMAVDYVGSVDARAHTMRPRRIFEATVGNGGPCQTFHGTCAAVAAPFDKHDGLYSSLVRLGNGMGAFNIPTAAGTVFGAQWYTGRSDRTPEWLILQGPIVGNQADVPVYRFRRTSTDPFAVESTVVGRAQVTYTSPTEYVATWVLDGVAAGEKLSLLYGTERPAPNRTGSWFAPSEPGWGVAIDDHFLPDGRAEQVIVNYFYDDENDPVWTLGGGETSGGIQPQNLFRVHCPSCPALSNFAISAQPAGTVAATYDGDASATYTIDLVVPGPRPGAWQRAALPLERLTPIPGRVVPARGK